VANSAPPNPRAFDFPGRTKEPSPDPATPPKRAKGRSAPARRQLSSWFSGWRLPVVAISLSFLAIGFASTFRTLWSSWMNNDNYSHGVLILPISVFLVWRMRRRLAITPQRSSWFGWLVLVPGVLLQIVGLRGDVTIFQGWAFVVVVAGLVWTWFGGTMFRRLLFPIAFLLFMVPALPVFMNKVSFELKDIAAQGSVALAQLFGAPVMQRGMDLYFPSGTLTVENACSGMNSLISLMALGALFAHVGEGTAWRRWLLFASAIPVAIAANVVRITSLCVYASLTSTDQASGVFHDVGGFVLFGVALVLLSIIKRMLRC